MSRREIKRVADRFIKNESITSELSDFFLNTLWFTGADIVVDEGITEIFNDPENHLIKKDIVLIERVLTEILFNRLVENFQTYLRDLLLAIFNHRPETLSGGSVKNDVVFNSRDLSDVKKYIIDKQVLDLGYKRIEEIDKYFIEKFKFSISDSRMQTLRLNRIIQIRNLISHNRGIVNSLFIKNAGAKIDKIGEQVVLPNLHAVDVYLINLACAIDGRAVDTFKLPQITRSGIFNG